MRSTRYRTRRGLWCIASTLVFIAIGLVVRFSIKGENQPLMRLMAEDVRLLLSGREEVSEVPVLLSWWGTWAAVAILVGWLIQSLMVIIFHRSQK